MLCLALAAPPLTEEGPGRNVHLSSLDRSEYGLVVRRRQAGRGDKQI